MRTNETTPVAKPGDWVRFYSTGGLVVGVVEYTRDLVGGWTELCTDRGAIRMDYVLEVRQPHGGEAR
jgi:hypothetical protein